MYRKVLLCYDGSREGRKALRAGADVVISMKAEAYLLAICQSLVTHAIPEAVTPALVEREDERANALLEEGVQWLRERGVPAKGSLEYGNAVECIAATAKTIGADLIVLGHKSRGRLARWWSASDEESLLERVSCSILVAMAEDEPA
jgi:nucleotide-binding universal stress UspA family protein